MQPLRAMNSEQKARLLHALLLEEIPHFLAYVSEVTEHIGNNQENIRAHWKDVLFKADFWINLAEDTQKALKKYGRQLEDSPMVFAQQLFGGDRATLLNLCLQQYVAQGRHQDPKFAAAVDLLVNP